MHQFKIMLLNMYHTLTQKDIVNLLKSLAAITKN